MAQSQGPAAWARFAGQYRGSDDGAHVLWRLGRIGCRCFRCCNTSKAPAKDKDIADVVVSIWGSWSYVDKAALFDVEDPGELIRGRRRCNFHI